MSLQNKMESQKLRRNTPLGIRQLHVCSAMTSKKKSFLTFKERGEPIDREGRGALRRLAGYKRAGKYEILIFCFVA